MSVLEDAAAWAAETFPDARLIHHRMKVAEEHTEFQKALGSVDELEEAADIVIALAAWAYAAGWNLEQAVEWKLGVNRERTWVRQKDGTYRHA